MLCSQMHSLLAAGVGAHLIEQHSSLGIAGMWSQKGVSAVIAHMQPYRACKLSRQRWKFNSEKRRSRGHTCNAHSREVVHEQCHHINQEDDGYGPRMEDHLQSQNRVLLMQGFSMQITHRTPLQKQVLTCEGQSHHATYMQAPTCRHSHTNFAPPVCSHAHSSLLLMLHIKHSFETLEGSSKGSNTASRKEFHDTCGVHLVV